MWRLQPYRNPRTFQDGASGDAPDDLGPEGLLFIPADESPIGEALLVVCFEESGTTRIFRVARK